MASSRISSFPQPIVGEVSVVVFCAPPKLELERQGHARFVSRSRQATPLLDLCMQPKVSRTLRSTWRSHYSAVAVGLLGTSSLSRRGSWQEPAGPMAESVEL